MDFMGPLPIKTNQQPSITKGLLFNYYKLNVTSSDGVLIEQYRSPSTENVAIKFESNNGQIQPLVEAVPNKDHSARALKDHSMKIAGRDRVKRFLVYP